MKTPVIVSTWSFGQRANAAAWPALSSGGGALDAVERACNDAEDDETNHTVGRGGYPDHTGRVSLDASVMLSPRRSGAVSGLRDFTCAATVARAVMERTPHRLLCGADADGFARSVGLPERPPLTDEAHDAWKKWVEAGRPNFPLANLEDQIAQRRASITEANHDTIGTLTIDPHGTMAGACSTSGLAFKLAGRVGDSPNVGHGLYVDPRFGAATCTGRGELIVGICAAFLAVEALRAGHTPEAAGRLVCERFADAYDLGPDDQAGIIILTADGSASAAALLPGFKYAIRTPGIDEVREPAFVLRG
jgi:N4-(beta-N-acetylglucosaminyl)-L-asparaginase